MSRPLGSQTDGTSKLGTDPMLKTTLLAAAAFLAIAFGAASAEAHSYKGHGYNHGYNYGHGYGYGHKKWGRYGHRHWNNCFSRPRPVTIRDWDHYRDRFVFKTVFRGGNRYCR